MSQFGLIVFALRWKTPPGVGGMLTETKEWCNSRYVPFSSLCRGMRCAEEIAGKQHKD